jgi:hypothetical protein
MDLIRTGCCSTSWRYLLAPKKIERLINKVERALAQEDYEGAKKHLNKARREAKRTSGTMTRLQAKIDTLEMISDDEKNSQAGE